MDNQRNAAFLKAKQLEKEAALLKAKQAQKEAARQDRIRRQNLQHRQIIECDHCGASDGDLFGSAAEKSYWSCIDTTGLDCRRCKQALCNPCMFPNQFNPGKKLMFCNPLCWIRFRGTASGVNSATYRLMQEFCKNRGIERQLDDMFDRIPN